MNKYEILLKDVKTRLDEFRYNHVCSVYRESAALSDIFELGESERDTLLTAAVLHDIAKPYDKIGQFKLADELSITLTDDDRESYKTIHAITGAKLAKKLYPEIVTDEVCECIRWHSTGKADMKTTEKLLFLADYIEPTRKFQDCIALRNYFYSLLDDGTEKHEALDKALIFAFDFTIKLLIEDKAVIHTDTVKARNFLVKHY